MPNEKVLSEKKVIVQELTEKLKSVSGVFIDYAGTTVAEDTEMRRAMRAANVDYAVVKNTLTRFASCQRWFRSARRASQWYDCTCRFGRRSRRTCKDFKRIRKEAQQQDYNQGWLFRRKAYNA